MGLTCPPGLLGRRHEAHGRGSDPCVEVLEAPRRVQSFGPTKTPQIWITRTHLKVTKAAQVRVQ